LWFLPSVLKESSALSELAAMIAERLAPDDGLERCGEAVAPGIQPAAHLVDQRLVGELHGAAERVAQQLATEGAAGFLPPPPPPRLQVVLEPVKPLEPGAVLQFGAGIHRAAAQVVVPEPADRVIGFKREAKRVDAAVAGGARGDAAVLLDELADGQAVGRCLV